MGKSLTEDVERQMMGLCNIEEVGKSLFSTSLVICKTCETCVLSSTVLPEADLAKLKHERRVTVILYVCDVGNNF